MRPDHSLKGLSKNKGDEMDITPKQAKSIIKAKLAELGLPEYKLTAKTIDFSDLARATCVFVKIHGWTPNPLFQELRDVAIKNGFRVQA